MSKRIFKTILILSICVGLTLPSNAAVSVSDGSAFVTNELSEEIIQFNFSNVKYRQGCDTV